MSLENVAIMTAMVTPFDEQGQIDYQKLPNLIDYLLAHHTEGLIIAGTTGESPTLSHEEELIYFKEVVRLVAGRVPIICGVGTNDTADTVYFTQEVAKIAGITAGLAVVPYYNKPNQEGLYQHFKAIAEASTLPIMLYNVPGRTITSLDVATTLRLAALPNVLGIKECAGQEAIAAIVEKAPADFYVYTGEDALAFTAKAIGGDGVISVASHVIGDEMHEMYQLLEQGEVKKAGKLQRQLLPKMAAVFSVPSPAPVKAVLNHRGIDVGGLRLPLVACTPAEEKEILTQLAK